VLALPSNYEPWGLIVNEAMSCARPAVVSDVAGCAPDLIEDGVTGYRFRSGDVGELADALHKSTVDPEHAKRMGHASLSRINTWDYEADVRALREGLARLFPERVNALMKAIPV
jgi:glycosyltransferase involved in cell wall biosynthesis